MLFDQNLWGTEQPGHSHGLDAAGQWLTAWVVPKEMPPVLGDHKIRNCAQYRKVRMKYQWLLTSLPPCAVTDLRAEVSSSPQNAFSWGGYCDSQP